MDIFISSLQADWETLQSFAPRFVYAAFALIFFAIVSFIADRAVDKLLSRSRRFRENRRFIRFLLRLAVMSLGGLAALGALGLHGVVASLLAAGGVIAVVLGFAFKEIGENFLAGFFLTFSRPFNPGDFVKTGDLTGVVQAIEWRHIHIRTLDACDVYVPSAQIFREALFNYTRDGVRRPSFTMGIDYSFEPHEVIELMLNAVKSTPDVLEDPVPFISIKAFAAHVIEYEVFFYIDVTRSERGLITTRNDVKIRCRDALNKAGVTFSTDVPTGIDIVSLPNLTVALTRTPADLA
jgi:small conductance mechanosensitive channel